MKMNKKFIEALVKTTVIERANVTYGFDGSIEEYESLDSMEIKSVEVLDVLYEDELDEEFNEPIIINIDM